ncbi:hypothetical protein G9U51_12150 [Calidifontibacter sp. DB0510]|uniref:DUF7847 domain-containing protein n=1 Tax=Metallococcus carri TaxID=1656884 RepID=A0A967B847_9MICO|nr:glycerophosphoryl diester phosphodiesterase membrane domain-containing protein [Metallococcus carri]NHN56531.1 hypothetical protein [Metallococcus carri]NOP38830.1 hypothetical protein [Calidifontibacter sp. DB2511S]
MSEWASPAGDAGGAEGRRPEYDGSAGPAYGGPPPAPGYGQPGGPAYGSAPQGPAYGGPPQGPAYGGPPQAPAYGTPPQGPAYGRPPLGSPYQQAFAPKPGVIPLRPLSLGDLFDGAFRTVRGNPGATLGLAALVLLTVAIPTTLLTVAVGGIAGDSTSGEALLGLGQYPGQAFGMLAGVILGGLLIVVLSEAVLGHRISIGQAWQRGKGRLLPLLGLTVLLALAALLVLGVIVAVVAGSYAAAGAATAVVVGGLLAIAFVVAAVFVATRMLFASAVIVLERQGVVAAMKRSWALTRGQFWRIFGIYLLASLLAGLVSSIVTLPAMMIVMATIGSTAPGGSVSMSSATIALVILQLASAIGQIITAPFLASVSGLLYIDQRIRREALDVTLMAAAAKR